VTGLIEVDPVEWDDLLERLGVGDAYLLRGYVESAALLEPGTPTLLHAHGDGGDVVFALLRREVPQGHGDVTAPYGYGGPVAVGAQPPLDGFWAGYDDWCLHRGLVASFIRFHPRFENHRYAGPAVHVEPIAATVGWRLQRDDLFEGMHRSHRNKCRKAERAGVDVSAIESPDDLAAFAALWKQTMKRVNAADFYFFADAYWEHLTTRFRERVVRFDAVADGELLASSVCLATPPWLHYHLGATGDRARAVGASNLLLYRAATWGRERGFERFHLGGGAGGRVDSLWTFKQHFDPGGLLECAVGKSVHDPETYRELSGREPDDLDGFFPAYRR
jgi:GNAT acetyltransferase-like protein